MQLAGFNLGNVEDVVDHVQQVFAGCLYLIQALGLGRADAGALEQAGHAEDGIHRRTNLVAHVGKKRALGDAGGLRRLGSLCQCLGALAHQFLQVVAVALELGGDTLLLGDVLDHAEDHLLLSVEHRLGMDVADLAVVGAANPELDFIGRAVLDQGLQRGVEPGPLFG